MELQSAMAIVAARSSGAPRRAMFVSLEGVELQPSERVANADHVVDDVVLRFRLVGEGIANAPVPLGSRVKMRLLHVFYMRAGLIARETVHEQWKRLD